MFNSFVETDELMPLYSAVKYIEFGSFFQKLDSIFVLIWIMCFVSYLSITLKFSSSILKKLANVKNEAFFTFLLSIIILFISTWPKKYTISVELSGNIYKYCFMALVIGVSFLILLLSAVKQKLRMWFK